MFISWCVSILLKEPFALKNSETVYFTSIFSTPSNSDIDLIDNFDLTFFYFYFVFEVLIQLSFRFHNLPSNLTGYRLLYQLMIMDDINLLFHIIPTSTKKGCNDWL